MRRYFILIVLLPSIASAWSTKEHVQLTRITIQRLLNDPATPAGMKQWLREASPKLLDMEGEKKWFMEQRMGIVPRDVDGLPFWAVMPDTAIYLGGFDTKVPPFGVTERPLHYIDLEYFLPGEAKREYRHDLSSKPKLSDIPRDMTDPRFVQAGMLPFRIEKCYQSLVEQLRAGRMNDRNGQHPRDEHAAKWAGYLAHYLQDNTQPQHATADYKSASYFAEKRKAPNVHSEMEYRMADDEHDDYLELRTEFWPLLIKALDEVKDPVETDDLFQATLEVAMTSYDALPLIGVAAMAAAKQGGTPDEPTGPAAGVFDTAVFFRTRGTYLGREMSVMEMKAHQLAWAVKRVERVWCRAWDEAHLN